MAIDLKQYRASVSAMTDADLIRSFAQMPPIDGEDDQSDDALMTQVLADEIERRELDI